MVNPFKWLKEYIVEYLEKRQYDKYARARGFRNWQEYIESIKQQD